MGVPVRCRDPAANPGPDPDALHAGPGRGPSTLPTLFGSLAAMTRNQRKGTFRRARCGVRQLLRAGVAFLPVLAGCQGGTGPVPLHDLVPEIRVTPPPADGLLTRPELQQVVDLQLRRDGEALIGLLSSPDAAVRARAALALATVQHPEGSEPLQALLADPDAPVRANAAFALGYHVLADGGERLVQALEQESDPEVRSRLYGALGRRGASGPIERLARMPAADEDAHAWTLALAQAGGRGIRSGELVGVLAVQLTHERAEVRLAAASFFGQTPTPGPWIPEAGRLRAALDSYRPEDPAAAHLVTALARLGNDGEDLERILAWMTGSPDWRTRAGAAIAVGTEGPWRDHPMVSEALWTLLEDPSGQVRSAAAAVLPLQLPPTLEVTERIAAWVSDPTRDWRTQYPFLGGLVGSDRLELVLAWTRDAAERHPFAAIRATEILSLVESEAVTDLLFELAEHEVVPLRGAALRAMATRWLQLGESDETFDRYLAVFERSLEDPGIPPAVWAARALSDPILRELGVESWLVETFRARRDEGDPNLLASLVLGFGASAEPLLREVSRDPDPRLAYAATLRLASLSGGPVPTPPGPITGPFRNLDWEALAAIGPDPRVHLETERGTLILRLLPEQAPLTVQLFLERVAAGDYDGVPFHRLLPGVLVQGGDVTMGDGTGQVAHGVQTELTQLPVGRGVVGMASAGRDTGGAQFFILHADHLRLEGDYTAFGWLESGGDILDQLLEGDRILGASIH